MKHDEQTKGILLAIAAFTWWGLGPLYFKLLSDVDVIEIMAHRITWSMIFLIVTIWLLNKPFRLVEILKTPSLLIGLTASGILISVNWLIYVWAISENQVLATALGYFINPLISVALGMFFLGEKLNNRQYIALSLVILAVLNQIWQYGALPWISLSLALTFGFYGLIRKKIDIDSFNGLLLEVTIILPFALAFLLWKMGTTADTQVSTDWQQTILLMLTGFVSVVPMALFATSVKIINLSTIGFIQYLAPSISFLLAVFVFKESLETGQLFSFILIWIALIFVSWDSIKHKLLNKTTELN
ncbi:MAG: EamA family transporter RarD [Gammaproteobacteria bacterium]|nr:MAG: EamA family transporter RarD [Gammaproteobacteria bacterium]